MRFGRGPQTIPEASPQDGPSEVEQLRGLVEVLVAERAAAELRAERAEQLAASYAARLHARRVRESKMIDAGPLVDELARLAGTELPKACAYAGELLGENVELASRAQRAEREASELVQAALRGDFAHLAGPDDED